MFNRYSLSFLASVVFVSACLSGCAVSPEKNPVIEKMRGQIAALEQTEKNNKRSIETLYVDVDNLTEEIRSLKSSIETVNASGGTKDLTAITTRLDQLEAKVRSIGESAPRAVQVVERRSGAAAPVAAPSAAPKTAVHRPAVQPKAARTVSTPQRSSAPKGFYYHVRPGDTVQSVASMHSTSSAAILRANKLPMSAVLYSGQSIYIPRG